MKALITSIFILASITASSQVEKLSVRQIQEVRTQAISDVLKLLPIAAEFFKDKDSDYARNIKATRKEITKAEKDNKNGKLSNRGLEILYRMIEKEIE